MSFDRFEAVRELDVDSQRILLRRGDAMERTARTLAPIRL
jgi:hypothetical protein